MTRLPLLLVLVATPSTDSCAVLLSMGVLLDSGPPRSL
jgi:hypothetical protein